MKKTLFIGSAVADMVICVDRLPCAEQDVNVLSRTMTAGGCAYNASGVYQQLGCPFTLFAPVGTGLYGDFVRSALAKRSITPAVTVPDRENGVCMCFVERSGERTFVCDHGAEYFFEPQWFDRLDMNEYDSVYICGLEIEESTGGVIIDFLEHQADKHITIYFAPGPRIMNIAPDKMNRLLRLHPVLHINEFEASSFTGIADPGTSCAAAASASGALCVVTCGSAGAYVARPGSDARYVPGFPAHVVDTIGAGDAHIGSFIAYQKKGLTAEEAVSAANKISAAVVSVRGAALPDNHSCFLQ